MVPSQATDLQTTKPSPEPISPTLLQKVAELDGIMPEPLIALNEGLYEPPNRIDWCYQTFESKAGEIISFSDHEIIKLVNAGFFEVFQHHSPSHQAQDFSTDYLDLRITDKAKTAISRLTPIKVTDKLLNQNDTNAGHSADSTMALFPLDHRTQSYRRTSIQKALSYELESEIKSPKRENLAKVSSILENPDLETKGTFRFGFPEEMALRGEILRELKLLSLEIDRAINSRGKIGHNNPPEGVDDSDTGIPIKNVVEDISSELDKPIPDVRAIVRLASWLQFVSKEAKKLGDTAVQSARRYVVGSGYTIAVGFTMEHILPHLDRGLEILNHWLRCLF